jgi:hypothetical protein
VTEHEGVATTRLGPALDAAVVVEQHARKRPVKRLTNQAAMTAKRPDG